MTPARSPRPAKPYEPLPGYRLVADRDHVTEEILGAVRSIESGWYTDRAIDWEDVWERLDGTTLDDGTRIDLGPVVDTPAMRYIQRTIRAERRAG